jgi:hypothetical protein
VFRAISQPHPFHSVSSLQTNENDTAVVIQAAEAALLFYLLFCMGVRFGFSLTETIRDSDGLRAERTEFDSRQRQRDSSLLYSVQTDYGAHAVSYPMGTAGSFTEGKATGIKNGGAIPPLPRMFPWHNA